MADDDYFDVDSFLNLDGVDEETSVGASAGPQQAPVALVLPLHLVPDAPYIQPDVQAAAPSVQLQHHLAPPAPMAAQHQQNPPAAPIQDQQMLGDLQACDLLDQLFGDAPSAYGFDDEIPAPIAHPQVPATAVQHQQILGESPQCGFPDQMLAEASAYVFDDEMSMPAPIAHGQQGFQAAPSDHVQHPQDPVTAVQHQQILGEASAYGFHDQMAMQANIAHGLQDFQAAPSDYVQHHQDPVTAVQHQQIVFVASAYGFHNQMPTPPPGSEEDIFSLPPTDSSDMVHEYLMQNGDHGIAVEFVSDQAMNHAGGNGAIDLMEDEKNFVPLWPGRLQCDHCRVVRKIGFQSETREVFIFLHSAADGSFEHAIMEINYHGDDIQAPKLYIDFSRQSHEVVLNFMTSTVDSLRNEKGGAVVDSDDASQNSNIIGAPPPPSPQDAEPPMEADADDNIFVEGLPAPRILEAQPSESAEVHSGMPAMQQERLEEEREIRQYLEELKEKAQKELDNESAAVKSFCRRNNCTYKVVRIRKLNRLIVSLSKNLRSHALSKLMTLRKRADECVIEKEQVSAQIDGAMKRKSNGNGAGPSRIKKGRAK